MYLHKFSVVVFFIGCAYQSLAADFDPTKINKNDLNRLKNTYPEFLNLKIEPNEFFLNQWQNGGLICPQPWDYLDRLPYLYYGNVQIVGKTLSQVVDSCIQSRSNYVICYATFLNVILSVGLTYIFRYAMYAWEMHKRKINIDVDKREFLELSKRIYEVFDSESIEEEDTVKFARDVTHYHLNHVTRYPNKSQPIYRRRLAACMERSEHVLDFVDLGPWHRPTYATLHIFDRQYLNTYLNTLEFFPDTDDGSSGNNDVPEVFSDFETSSGDDGYDYDDNYDF